LVNEASVPPSIELQSRLPQIESWVRDGGVLVLHNGYPTNTHYFWPLLSPVSPAQYGTYANVVPPDTLVSDGPFGALVEYDVHGEFSIQGLNGAVRGTSLPPQTRRILGYVDDVAFSFPLGRGYVYYSVIPLEAALEESQMIAITNLYAPNVVVYANSLVNSVTQPVEEVPPPVFVFGPDSTTWTESGFQLQISGLSGLRSIVISASTNLIDWQPVFTNPPASGTLRFLDPGASNYPARFYRVEER
jgi:hypothetical protein